MPTSSYLKFYLLLREQMQRVEKLCINSGHRSEAQLMERAAGSVALELKKKFPRGTKTLILCGPGNNGKDGLVLARILQRQGWPVEVLLLTPKENKNRHAFSGKILPWPFQERECANIAKQPYRIVVDALFGTGLTRPLPMEAQVLLKHLNAQTSLWRVSIDLPSGVDGDTGRIFGDPALGNVFQAHTTVTFFLKKQGQLLLPGRLFCGDVLLQDIGIPFSLLRHLLKQKPLPKKGGAGARKGKEKNLKEETFKETTQKEALKKEVLEEDAFQEVLSQENHPSLWWDSFPCPHPQHHKYHRGHCLIVGQEAMPGASALAAKGAMRLGCGLCTLTTPPSLKTFYLQQLPCALVETREKPMDFIQCLQQKKRNAVLIGPGAGTDKDTYKERLEELFLVLESKVPCVLDADALNLFSKEHCHQERQNFFSHLHEDCVLTPHEGEFAKLFPELQGPFRCKVTQAKEASSLIGGATLLLKGADTVIAQGSKARIQNESPATLSTAGSGDVLAGAIISLIAQKMSPFEAACAATWIHSKAATLFGPGLIATDLPELFPKVLRDLQAAFS